MAGLLDCSVTACAIGYEATLRFETMADAKFKCPRSVGKISAAMGSGWLTLSFATITRTTFFGRAQNFQQPDMLSRRASQMNCPSRTSFDADCSVVTAR